MKPAREEKKETEGPAEQNSSSIPHARTQRNSKLGWYLFAHTVPLRRRYLGPSLIWELCLCLQPFKKAEGRGECQYGHSAIVDGKFIHLDTH